MEHWVLCKKLPVPLDKSAHISQQEDESFSNLQRKVAGTHMSNVKNSTATSELEDCGAGLYGNDSQVFQNCKKAVRAPQTGGGTDKKREKEGQLSQLKLMITFRKEVSVGEQSIP